MKKTPTAKLTYQLGGQIEINRIGYGSMQLTGQGVWGNPVNRQLAIEVLQATIASGINFIDTADSYGPHTTELLIHDAIKADYDKVCIATKGGFIRTGPGEWQVNGDPEYIAQTIEGSLKRLDIKQLQLWQLHRVDPKVPIEETLAPVAEAVKAGKINQVGLSEVDINMIERARKVLPIVSVQNQYNLANRTWEHVLDYTARHGIAFIPWYPLASGPNKLKEKLAGIAEAHQATTAQIALAWLLHHSPNILLIPGTSSIIHLIENLKAAQIQLSDVEYEELSTSNH